MVRALPESTLTHLGDLTVEAFMRRYWQRRPLLVRQALTGLRPPVSVERLLALAARPDVQSRLVSSFAGRWALREGPLAPGTLPARTRGRWTVLVHGVDAHVAAAARLLARFRFVPDARLDDLMVSYATDGGGVGPHVDSYDVFLIQAQGRRRWRISRQRDLATVPGLPLRILADFRPEREWVLEPGDLLYLPPGIAHEGVAVGSGCVTCSVGFRAPSWRAVAERWFDDALEAAPLQRPHRDPGLAATRTPARLPEGLVDAAFARLRSLRPSRATTARALLATLSEPARDATFRGRAGRPDPAAFRALLRRRGLRADRRTRMLYSAQAFAINGEVHAMRSQARPWLTALADHRMLDPVRGRAPDAATVVLLHDWYRAGWLHADGRAARAPIRPLRPTRT